MMIKNCNSILFVVLSLIAITGVSAYDANDIILEDKILKKINYRTISSATYPASLCESYEKPIIPAIKKQYQKIKSYKSLKSYKNIYYRFTVILEEYESEEQAKRRIEQMTFPYKTFKTDSWYSKQCGMKQGFQYDNKTFFLTTDAAIFSDEIPILLEKLKAEIISDVKPTL